MIGALIILAVTVVIGVILYILDRTYYRKRRSRGQLTAGESGESVEGPAAVGSDGGDSTDGEEECCGMHAVCEKTSLSPLSTEAEYYDDEELDRYRGRTADSYTPVESEEFREVLMTLLPSDVAGWSRSLQIREIVLPEDVRDELLMIVREQRDRAAEQNKTKTI